jgi:hypothetical protein
VNVGFPLGEGTGLYTSIHLYPLMGRLLMGAILLRASNYVGCMFYQERNNSTHL